MSWRRKFCAAKPRKWRKHVVTKFRRAVSVKITVLERERSNTVASFRDGRQSVTERDLM